MAVFDRNTVTAKLGGRARGIATDVRCGGYRYKAIHFGVGEGVGHMLRAVCDKDQLATMLNVDGIGVTTTCCAGNVPEFAEDAGSCVRVLLLFACASPAQHHHTVGEMVQV